MKRSIILTLVVAMLQAELAWAWPSLPDSSTLRQRRQVEQGVPAEVSNGPVVPAPVPPSVQRRQELQRLRDQLRVKRAELHVAEKENLRPFLRGVMSVVGWITMAIMAGGFVSAQWQMPHLASLAFLGVFVAGTLRVSLKLGPQVRHIRRLEGEVRSLAAQSEVVVQRGDIRQAIDFAERHVPTFTTNKQALLKKLGKLDRWLVSPHPVRPGDLDGHEAFQRVLDPVWEAQEDFVLTVDELLERVQARTVDQALTFRVFSASTKLVDTIDRILRSDEPTWTPALVFPLPESSTRSTLASALSYAL